MRALVALLVVAFSFGVVGCKKKRDTSLDFAYAFSERMCACKDMACAQKVLNDYTHAIPKQPTPEMMASAQAGAACFDKLMAGGGSGEVPGVLPTVPPKRQVDLLIAAIREQHKALGIHELQASYVEADGTLDDEHGVLSIQLGATPVVVDNPKRKTGAPVSAANRPESCPLFSFTKAAGWARSDDYCRDASAFPKCSAEAIWKRALAAGAPKDAVAVIKYSYASEPKWSFLISDIPRGVSFDQSYKDDCEPVVEKVP